MIKRTLKQDSKVFTCFIVFFSLLCVVCGTCISAPVGNPGGPLLLDGKYPTKFTLEAETVLGRDMKSGSSGDPKFYGTFYTGKVSLYVGNKLDFYGLVGIYDGKIKNFISSEYLVDSKAGPVLGLGLSYVLHEMECLGGLLRFGADGKYRQFNPDVDAVKYYRERIATTANALSFKEWQASLGLSYQYKMIAPYAGLKYSDMNAKVEFTTEDGIDHTDTTVSSKDIWGFFYGVDFLLGDNVSLNVEMRQGDEKALNVGLNARF